MKADPAAQHRLLDLQQIDTALALLQHRRASLPELAALKEGAAKRVELADALVAAETVVSDLEREQARAESDLEPVRARLVRDQQRVDAGTVSDPKALSGMIDEIASLKKRIGDLEDVELDVMERLETASADRDRIAGDKTALETDLRALLKARDAKTAQTDAELADPATEREAQLAALPNDLVALYDKLRARRGGGATALKAGRCEGCQLEVNAADLRRFNAAPADEVLRCEECGRILVRV